VKHTNWTLKYTITKLAIKTHLDWIKLLPFAILKIRAMPKKPLQISLFDILYG
jgi:hypothetical protein